MHAAGERGRQIPGRGMPGEQVAPLGEQPQQPADPGVPGIQPAAWRRSDSAAYGPLAKLRIAIQARSQATAWMAAPSPAPRRWYTRWSQM